MNLSKEKERIQSIDELNERLAFMNEYLDDRRDEILILIKKLEDKDRLLEDKGKKLEDKDTLIASLQNNLKNIELTRANQVKSRAKSKYTPKNITEKICRKINPFNSFNRKVRLILKSKLFDSEWYIQQRPQLMHHTKKQLIIHYLVAGVNQGLSPSEKFDTIKYFSENKMVAASGENPLIDYIYKTNKRVGK